MVEQKITQLLEEKFKEPEFEDCYLVDLELSKGNKLNVFVDSDSGMSFKKCQRISRYLESHLDEKLWLGEKYILEVSSPGVDRPLKFLRQYHKNIGRTAEMTTVNGETKKGKIVAVNGEAISLESKERIKEGKKKKTVIVSTEIPFDQIEKTIIKITFK